MSEMQISEIMNDKFHLMEVYISRSSVQG